MVLIAFTNAISSSVPYVNFSSGRSYNKLDRILAKKSQYVDYALSQCRKTGPNITGGVVFPLLSKFGLVYTSVVTYQASKLNVLSMPITDPCVAHSLISKSCSSEKQMTLGAF